MAQQLTGAKKLIDDRGGYRVVAEVLKWPLTTVHTFYRTNAAPKYRWDAIVALPLVERAVTAAKPDHPKRRRPADASRKAA